MLLRIYLSLGCSFSDQSSIRWPGFAAWKFGASGNSLPVWRTSLVDTTFRRVTGWNVAFPDAAAPVFAWQNHFEASRLTVEDSGMVDPTPPRVMRILRRSHAAHHVSARPS